MVFGISSLHFFGISCTSSISDGTDYVNVNSDSDSDVNSDDYGGWRTEYYNLDSYCGYSVSDGFNFTLGTYTKWETVYYNSKNEKIGYSVSDGTNYSYGSYSGWNATYYNLAGIECGTSTSDGLNYHVGGYCGWNTTYFRSGNECGTSESTGTNYSHGCYSGWKTIYHNCKGVTVLQQEQENTSNFVFLPKANVTNYINVDFETCNFIRNVKKYYISKAGIFNASSSIFKDKNLNDISKIERDRIITELKSRAKNNPNGASDKTLKYFGLK